MKTLQIAIWIITCCGFWIFAVASTVDNKKLKHYEFKYRSVFYWLAVLVSFLFGAMINK